MGDLKNKFILQYMGIRQLLKSIDALDNIGQMSDESLGYLYTRLNKELTSINQVIMEGETICTFVRALGPRGFSLYDNLSLIPVNTVEEMTVKGKSYRNLEIAKEVWKAHKESKKVFHEGKK